MLSRVAENLYWMTRYMERAEDTARLINAVTLMVLDIPGEVRFRWDTLLKVAGLDHIFAGHYQQADEASVMKFLIRDENNPSSIMTCIRHARENTRTFREVLPRECWEWINELYLYGRKHLLHDFDRRHRYDALQAVIRQRQSIVGSLAGTMSRDAAYQFLRMGRNLERADMTTRILDVSYAVLLPDGGPASEQYGDLVWMNILKALSGYQMFRRYVSVHATSTRVIDFMLTDVAFPRTVMHCLNEITDVLNQLPHPGAPMTAVNDVRRLVERVDTATLTTQGLNDLLDETQAGLACIDAALQRQYFRTAALDVAA